MSSVVLLPKTNTDAFTLLEVPLVVFLLFRRGHSLRWLGSLSINVIVKLVPHKTGLVKNGLHFWHNCQMSNEPLRTAKWPSATIGEREILLPPSLPP